MRQDGVLKPGVLAFCVHCVAFIPWKVPAMGLSRAECSTVGCTESMFYTEDCSAHDFIPRAAFPPCCRNITGEQPVGVAESEVSSCCDMPRTLSTSKGVVMARHRRWSWSLIAPSRVAMASLATAASGMCVGDQLDAGHTTKALTGPG